MRRDWTPVVNPSLWPSARPEPQLSAAAELALDGRLRELLHLPVPQINNCRYSRNSHAAAARQADIPPPKMPLLRARCDTHLFSDTDRFGVQRRRSNGAGQARS